MRRGVGSSECRGNGNDRGSDWGGVYIEAMANMGMARRRWRKGRRNVFNFRKKSWMVRKKG